MQYKNPSTDLSAEDVGAATCRPRAIDNRPYNAKNLPISREVLSIFNPDYPLKNKPV